MLVVVVCFGWSQVFEIKTADAAVSKLLNYQAKISDSSGYPLAGGNYDAEFRICLTVDCSGGTDPVWSETWNSGTSQVHVTDGLFSILLGTHASMDLDFNEAAYYLGVNFNSDGWMLPQKRIAGSPFSLNTNLYRGQDLAALTDNFSIMGDDTAARTITLGQTGSFDDILIVDTANFTLNTSGDGVFYGDLVVGGSTSTTPTLSGGLVLNGDDLFVAGDFGVEGNIYTDGDLSLAAGGYINWGAILGSGGYGFRDNTGIMEYKNSAGDWLAFDDLSAGGYWTDAGGYLYPTSGEYLGNNNASSSYKVSGLYLGDGADLMFGNDNDVLFDFATSTLNVTFANSADMNFDNSTFFIDSSEDGLGIGTNSLAANDKLKVLLSATEKVYIDGYTTQHSGTDGLIDLDLLTATDFASAINITVASNGLSNSPLSIPMGVSTTLKPSAADGASSQLFAYYAQLDPSVSAETLKGQSINAYTFLAMDQMGFTNGFKGISSGTGYFAIVTHSGSGNLTYGGANLSHSGTGQLTGNSFELTHSGTSGNIYGEDIRLNTGGSYGGDVYGVDLSILNDSTNANNIYGISLDIDSAGSLGASHGLYMYTQDSTAIDSFIRISTNSTSEATYGIDMVSASLAYDIQLSNGGLIDNPEGGVIDFRGSTGSDDYIYFDTNTGLETIYFNDESLAYSNDPGIRLGDDGILEYRDQDVATWTDFGGGGGLSQWSTGTYGLYYAGDDVIVGGDTADETPLTDTNFILSGNDLFVEGALGVGEHIYTNGSLVIAQNTILSDGWITYNGTEEAFYVANLADNGVLGLIGMTEVAIGIGGFDQSISFTSRSYNAELLPTAYFVGAGSYSGADNPGLSIDDNGLMMYKDALGGWTSFTALAGGGGYWQKVGTDISPLASGDDLLLNAGETLTISDLNPGGVLFAGAAGLVSDDYTQFYWDSSNNRLGLGTNNPLYKSHTILGASERVYIDAYTTNHTDTNGALTINFQSPGNFSSALQINATSNGAGGGGAPLFGQRTILTPHAADGMFLIGSSNELASGLTAGDFSGSAPIVGSANIFSNAPFGVGKAVQGPATAYGTFSWMEHQGSGDIEGFKDWLYLTGTASGNMYGANYEMNNSSSGANSVYGINLDFNDTGAMQNLYGINMDIDASGFTSEAYGLKINTSGGNKISSYIKLTNTNSSGADFSLDMFGSGSDIDLRFSAGTMMGEPAEGMLAIIPGGNVSDDFFVFNDDAVNGDQILWFNTAAASDPGFRLNTSTYTLEFRDAGTSYVWTEFGTGTGSGGGLWSTSSYGIYYSDDDVIVGTSGDETITNVGFNLDGGNSLFVAGTLGVKGDIYTDGSLYVGDTFSVANGMITQSSGILGLIGAGDVYIGTQTNDFLIMSTRTDSQVVPEILFAGVSSYNDAQAPGLSVNNDGQMVYKNALGNWIPFDTLAGGSGSLLWIDGGDYLYPGSNEFLGNSASDGANKMAGLYLADGSDLMFGTTNDVLFNFSAASSALNVSFANNADMNFDSNTFFIDSSEDGIGIGTNSLGANDKLKIVLGANEKVYIDAYTTQHTGTEGALDIDYLSNESLAAAIDINAVSAGIAGGYPLGVSVVGQASSADATEAGLFLYSAGLGANSTFGANSSGVTGYLFLARTWDSSAVLKVRLRVRRCKPLLRTQVRDLWPV